MGAYDLTVLIVLLVVVVGLLGYLWWLMHREEKVDRLHQHKEAFEALQRRLHHYLDHYDRK